MPSYERTLAPSEELVNFVNRRLGADVEFPIWSHYLLTTGADLKPGGVPTDFRDTGVPTDYINVLLTRHSSSIPTLTKEALLADLRAEGQFAIPDISTFKGRYVPPRVTQDSAGNVTEDRGRSEYYEIKPNSDGGERDGINKLKIIKKSLRKHKLDGLYAAGQVYPLQNPVIIPLRWSKAFEYFRQAFMWANDLKTCEVDLQITKPTDPRGQGLLLYAFRIKFEYDVQKSLDKLRLLTAAVMAYLGFCAAEGALGLAMSTVALNVSKELLEFLEAARQAQDVPGVPTTEQPKVRFEEPPQPQPRVRVDPGPGPRVPIEEGPSQIPEVELEDDPYVPPDDLEIPRRKRMMLEAVTSRGYGLPNKPFDVYCDEDYFQNVVLDRTTAQRAAAIMRQPLPQSPFLVAPAAAASAIASVYGQVIKSGFKLASHLLQQMEAEKWFPNQVKASIQERIPDALRRFLIQSPNDVAMVVSQVLPGTALVAALIDPTLKRLAREHITPAEKGAAPRGQLVLPQGLLARWTGRDARMGSRKHAETPDDVKQLILGSAPDEGYRKFLTEALSNLGVLKHALHAPPGFTLAIGVHALYTNAAGAPITAANPYGTRAGSLHVSRLFAIAAKPGSKPPAKLTQAELNTTADNPAEVVGGTFRYLGRLRLTGGRIR